MYLVVKEEPVEKDIITTTALERFGIEKLFPQQRMVISNILHASGYYGEEEAREAPKQQLVILPTGMGKSICFMLPSLLIKPLTMVIFPLLSLMQDQKRRFDEARIPCTMIRGGQSREERKEIYRDLINGRTRALLVNPEVLRNEELLQSLSSCGPVHMVLDEAHTLPEWGESFRPAYLELAKIASTLPVSQITAFTATAGERIIHKITELLFSGVPPHLISEIPDRPNIHYRVIPSLSRIHDIARLLPVHGRAENQTGSLPRPAVVFCRTRVETELVARELRMILLDSNIRFFHAGLERSEKERIAQWFFSSNDGILTATTAYGMGVDKKNIRTVIHHRPAPSIEAFLQESGRAGRDRKAAWSVVLLSPEDIKAVTDQRYHDLLKCFRDRNSCRRIALMALMDATIKECTGCDVCDGTAVARPLYFDIYLGFFHLMPLLWNRQEAAKKLDHLLPGVSEEEKIQTIKALVNAGFLKQPKKGPWRGLICPADFPFSMLRSPVCRFPARAHNRHQQRR
jgi:ATP-dependent DNA helicase RecQ